MKSLIKQYRLFFIAILASFVFANSYAEDELSGLAGASQLQPGVSQSDIDFEVQQLHSELRAMRDLYEFRINTMESEIDIRSSYTERLLFGFLIAGGFVVFIVLLTINKQSNVYNERMRNLIREADNTMDDLHRMLDRPETEHFHVSRKLGRIMNKFRERENPSLPQKEITDIYAASEDPTLPVSLHIQANALRAELGGNWSEAIPLWEKLLAIDDTSPEVLLQLAQNYKRLSEVSSGDTASKLRKISLDYFQKYARRTNTHSHSERELRKMGEVSMGIEAVSGANTRKHHIPKAAQHVAQSSFQEDMISQPIQTVTNVASDAAQVVAKQLSLMTKSLQEVTTSTKEAIAPAVIKKPVSVVSEQPVAEVSATPEPDTSTITQAANGTAEVVASEPVVEEIKLETTVSVDAQITQQKKEAEQIAAIVAAAPEKPNNEATNPVAQPANKKAVKKAKYTKHKADAAKSKANGKSKMSDNEIAAVVKSRSQKALDYFNRYLKATDMKERIALLQAVEDEYSEMSKYKQDQELYQMWGYTIFELANLDTKSQKKFVLKSIEIFKEANKKCEGAFFNELALSYAKIGNEIDCKIALSKARQKEILNTELLTSQKEYKKFANASWYKEILSASA